MQFNFWWNISKTRHRLPWRCRRSETRVKSTKDNCETESIAVWLLVQWRLSQSIIIKINIVKNYVITNVKLYSWLKLKLVDFWWNISTTRHRLPWRCHRSEIRVRNTRDNCETESTAVWLVVQYRWSQSIIIKMNKTKNYVITRSVICKYTPGIQK